MMFEWIQPVTVPFEMIAIAIRTVEPHQRNSERGDAHRLNAMWISRGNVAIIMLSYHSGIDPVLALRGSNDIEYALVQCGNVAAPERRSRICPNSVSGHKHCELLKSSLRDRAHVSSPRGLIKASGNLKGSYILGYSTSRQ